MDENIIDVLPFTIVELAPIRDDQGQIVDFVWVYANERSNRVVLPEGGSIVGQRVCDIDPAYRNSDMFSDAVLCIETGEPRELFNSSRTPTPHGRLKHLEGTVVRYSIIPKGEGCVIFALEITDLVHARDEANDWLEMFRSAFDHAVQAITLTSESSQLIYANQALYDLLGYAPGELEGKSSQIIMRPEGHQAVIKAGTKMWGGKIEQEIMDLTLIGKAGNEIVVSNALSSIYSEVRGERIFISHARDVRADRKLAHDLASAVQKAEHATQLKSEFLANMSHELRTPLNGILGMAQVLTGGDLSSAQAEQVSIILESGQSLLAILNDILDLSKIEAGKIDIIPVPVNLYSLTKEIKNLFDPKVNEKKIDFFIEYESTIPKLLLLDEVRLRQILFNLIGNAIKFTDNGHVILTVDAHRNIKLKDSYDLILHVEDTGIGIPIDQQKLIFEPFSQQKGQSAKYGGTGLGLPITKKLIEKMGGTIHLESEAGKGSNIRVIIPNIPISETEIEPEESLIDLSIIKFNKAKILLVDDNECIRLHNSAYGFSIRF